MEPLLVEGFEEIVESVGFKCLDSVLIVSRHKHHDGHILSANLLHHTEAVEFRHFNIEEKKVRLMVVQRRDRFFPILTFSNNFKVLLTRQQPPDSVPG